MTSAKKIALGFVIPIIFLLFVLSIVGYKEIITAFSTVSLSYFPVVILILILVRVFNAGNVYVLLKSLKINVSFINIFKYVQVSAVLTRISPAGVGQVSLMYFLKKHEKISYGPGGVIFLTNKLVTLFLAIGLSFLGAIKYFAIPGEYVILLCILGGVSVIFSFLLFSNFFKKLFKKYVLRKYAGQFRGFTTTLFQLIKRPNYFLINIVITAAQIILAALNAKLVLFSLGYELAILPLMTIVSFMTILASIPLPLMQLGIAEISGAYLLYLNGVPLSIGISTFLILVVLRYGVLLAAYFWAQGILTEKADK